MKEKEEEEEWTTLRAGEGRKQQEGEEKNDDENDDDDYVKIASVSVSFRFIGERGEVSILILDNGNLAFLKSDVVRGKHCHGE